MIGVPVMHVKLGWSLGKATHSSMKSFTQGT